MSELWYLIYIVRYLLDEECNSESEKEKEFICGNYIPLSPVVDDDVFCYGNRRRSCDTILEERPPSADAIQFGLWFDLIEPDKHEPDATMYDSTEPRIHRP